MIGKPWLDEVIVDLAERDRGHDRIRGRVVALDEQNPLRQRMKRMSAREEVDAGHLRHRLVGDQQGDLLVVVRECREPIEPARGSVRGDDPGVVPEPSFEPDAILRWHRAGFRAHWHSIMVGQEGPGQP